MNDLDDTDLDELLAEIDQMTDAELDDLIAEVEAEDAAYGDDDYGPWHDEAAQLAAAGSALDFSYATEAARAAEDEQDAAALRRRPSAEDRLARAMQRIERGTYLPRRQLRTDLASAADRLGLHPDHCGDTDDLGYCTARFHDRRCSAVTSASAATGSAEAAGAWRDTLLSHVPDPETVLLAASPEPHGGAGFWDDVLDGGGPDPWLHAQMLDILGEHDQLSEGYGLPPRLTRPPGPRLDISSIRTALGL